MSYKYIHFVQDQALYMVPLCGCFNVISETWCKRKWVYIPYGDQCWSSKSPRRENPTKRGLSPLSHPSLVLSNLEQSFTEYFIKFIEVELKKGKEFKRLYLIFFKTSGQNRVPFYFSGRNGPKTPSHWPAPSTTRCWPHLRRVYPTLVTYPPRGTRLLYPPARKRPD